MALLGIAAPVRIAAQTAQTSPESSGWKNEVAFTATNALVGGLTAGIGRKLHGGSFLAGFERGLAGGALHYAGKRMLATDFPGHYLVARQVSAVGTSIVVNAAENQGSFDRLFFPIGPLALETESVDGHRSWSPSLDLYDVTRIASAALSPSFQVDWGTTFATGTVVFDGRDRVLRSQGVNGRTGGSVVLLEEAQAAVREQVVQHEMTHVLQRDMINRAWFYPAERRLVEQAMGGRRWPEQLRLGLLYPAFKSTAGQISPLRGMLHSVEAESEWMEGR